ncbi:unnamed protein product [Oreochromis niloticus]|nr:unnamed protein product [Mustela putorius furo]
MASPRWSTSMLLASLILLLYWTTSSARSHDSTSTDLSPPHRGISNIASLAPVIGGLVSPIVNVVLAFVPQENPLKELREGFSQVNRKLDSLSLQISNLATDVEWFNYASVCSQDEVRILNAWKKFEEFRENSGLVNTAEDELQLAEIFTNYYENTAVEASVANLYHYLTVSSTSLSGNLNKLLEKKFKCSIREIGKYNIYFSSLLWRGMVLNQLFWNLVGFNPSGKEAEQTQMFKNVSEAQISAVKFCRKNYTQYMEKDVEEIGKAMNPDDKQAIAYQNGGKCESLLDSNDWLCECPDGYYGDTCEKESTISVASETDLQHPVPDISTIDIKLDKMESKLKNMESKLEEISAGTST